MPVSRPLAVASGSSFGSGQSRSLGSLQLGLVQPPYATPPPRGIPARPATRAEGLAPTAPLPTHAAVARARESRHHFRCQPVGSVQDRAMPKVLSPAQIEAFDRDGFVAPVRAIPAQRALYYRQCLE